MKKQQIPLTPVLAVAFVIFTAVLWFLVVGPKQAAGGELTAQIADYETKIVLAQQPKTETPVVDIEVADVFRLAKALPDNEDMAGVMLELNAVATASGINFVAISPGTAATRDGYYAVPVTLTLEGNYYDLADFLFRLRNLVSVSEGVLEANGRLYTLDTLEIHESRDGFPQIEAVLVISAYVYGVPEGSAEDVPAAPPATTTTTDTTATTTTPATTTAPPTSTNNAIAPIPGAPGQPTPGTP